MLDVCGTHDTYRHGQSRSSKTKESINVLVLDDSYADYDAIRRSLNRMDMIKASVTRAKTIEDARRVCSEDVFDVVFIDYDLGIDSGIRFLQEIGGRGSQMLPILVTGLPDTSVLDIALDAGAVGLINKADISPTLLESTIRSAYYSQHVENRLHKMIAAL